MHIPILYQDDKVIIIDKPRGISVQPGEKAGKTILDLVSEEYKIPVWPVHRLDRETSGCLVLALNKEAAKEVTRGFEDGIFSKTYIAIVKGSMNQNKGSITESIMQHGEEKKARTDYKVIETFEVNDDVFSLLELTLFSGRMHQIRIHLNQERNPILGDDKHGDFQLNKRIKKEYGVKHLMLHAKKIEGKGFSAITEDCERFTDFLHRIKKGESV